MAEPTPEQMKTQHIAERVRRAGHSTRTLLHGQAKNGFTADHYIAGEFTEEAAAALNGLACISKLDTNDGDDQDIVAAIRSRVAVAHYFGERLVTDPKYRPALDSLFTENLQHLGFSAGLVGIDQTLRQGSDVQLASLFSTFEAYQPPTRAYESPELFGAYMAGSATTCLLMEYVGPMQSNQS